MSDGVRFKMTRRIVRALAAVALAASVALPASAQFSERYEFFKAVRSQDAATVVDMLAQPGQTLVNARESNSGDTALHMVTEAREPAWINLLQQNGADVNVADEEGETPLIIAAGNRFIDGARLLIHYGADVNRANRRGETPLIRAVQRRDYDMVELLLAQGADPDHRDSFAGYSAREYAERDRRARRILDLIEASEDESGTTELSGPGL